MKWLTVAKQRLGVVYVTDHRNKKTQTTCLHVVWVSISDDNIRLEANIRKKITVWKAGALDRGQLFN